MSKTSLVYIIDKVCFCIVDIYIYIEREQKLSVYKRFYLFIQYNVCDNFLVCVSCYSSVIIPLFYFFFLAWLAMYYACLLVFQVKQVSIITRDLDFLKWDSHNIMIDSDIRNNLLENLWVENYFSSTFVHQLMLS